MTRPIKTIKRTKDMPESANYRLVDCLDHVHWFNSLPSKSRWTDQTWATLRRIVDRDPPKKPSNRDALKALWPKGLGEKPSAKDVHISSEIGDFDDPPKKAKRKMPTVIDEIANERRRQTKSEGWTPAHDDEHVDGELAQAAACYAMPPQHRQRHADPRLSGVPGWPLNWCGTSWKPKDARRDLIRAAALIVAEIERIDRSAIPAPRRKGGGK